MDENNGFATFVAELMLLGFLICGSLGSGLLLVLTNDRFFLLTAVIFLAFFIVYSLARGQTIGYELRRTRVGRGLRLLLQDFLESRNAARAAAERVRAEADYVVDEGYWIFLNRASFRELLSDAPYEIFLLIVKIIGKYILGIFPPNRRLNWNIDFTVRELREDFFQGWQWKSWLPWLWISLAGSVWVGRRATTWVNQEIDFEFWIWHVQMNNPLNIDIFGWVAGLLAVFGVTFFLRNSWSIQESIPEEDIRYETRPSMLGFFFAPMIFGLAPIPKLKYVKLENLSIGLGLGFIAWVTWTTIWLTSLVARFTNLVLLGAGVFSWAFAMLVLAEVYPAGMRSMVMFYWLTAWVLYMCAFYVFGWRKVRYIQTHELLIVVVPRLRPWGIVGDPDNVQLDNIGHANNQPFIHRVFWIYNPQGIFAGSGESIVLWFVRFGPEFPMPV